MKHFKVLSASLFALASITMLNNVQAATQQQLMRCMDTEYEQGAYGQYYGMTYHGTDQVCGGDDLGYGAIKIKNNGHIQVRLENANHDPFVMYEVYWVPVGQDPVTSRVMLGNLLTDCNGNASTILRDINTPVDRYTAPPVNISHRVGTEDAGNFYFYSRGPWGFNDDGSCKPQQYNTTDNTATGTLANPVLWGGTTNTLFDGVQFISAYMLESNKDSDNDGIPDLEDNCVGRKNPGQRDFDLDGFGNACDRDDDNDGFTDKQERLAGSDKFDPSSTPE